MIAATIADGVIAPAEHPDPEPGGGEVLVRVRAAGLNGADMHQLAGHYPAPPGSPPDIPGRARAGGVAALGSGASRFAIGDRVMGIVGGGGQAELAVVHERQLMPVPDGMTWEAAGGFPEVFTTAHDALFTQCALAAGERLLVHGGAGGVGTAAVQIAAAAGVRVHATVRDPGARAAVGELGATVIAPEGFPDHGPFDVILELVGAPNLAADVDALESGGRIAVVGIGGGARGELDLRPLMSKRALIRGTMLRMRPLEEKALAARAVERQVLPLLAQATVVVPIAATFPLDQVAAAYERFAAGAKLGKIILLVS